MPMQMSAETLSSYLNHSKRDKTVAYALNLHFYTSKIGLEGHKLVGNLLACLLANVGEVIHAQKVFGKLAVKMECSWSSLINAYFKLGESSQAFTLYESMTEASLQPNDLTYVALLNACGRLKQVERGNGLYAEIAAKGLMMSNQFIGNALVYMYAKCGLLVKAQEVFDMLPSRDVVSWTALIGGYAQHNHGDEALKRYQQMRLAGIQPNVVTYTCTLKACGSTVAIAKGKEIHAQVEREGSLKTNSIIGNVVVDMYVKCGLILKAQEVFDGLAVRDVVVWNTLISGHVHHGFAKEALDYYERMLVEGVHADGITFTSILKACALTKAIAKGREIHSEIKRNGLLLANQFVGNALVDMYAKCGFLGEAQEVFDKLPVHQLVAWNALIVGYTDNDHGGEALQCFKQMQHEGVSPDAITIVSAMKACGSIGASVQGMNMHKHFEQKGLFEGDPSLGSQLVDIYAKWGFLVKAQEEFDKLFVRDEVAWTSLIAGYAQHEYDDEALVCFEQMQAEGILPDSVTFACSLKACGSSGLSDRGQELHAEVVRKGLIKADNYLVSALIDMYAKSGLVMQAQEVFDSMSIHDVIAWTALITGYAQQGEIERVLWIFDEMREATSPNSITFLSLLNSCSHTGLIETGQACFQAMIKNYGIFPSFEHYTCIVDLFGRAGQLDKAVAILNETPFYDNMVMWRTLLGSCRKWHDVQLAKQAYEHAVQLDDNEIAAHISMFNIYADAGLLEDAERMDNC